jgi:type I restriction enzyme S subunit
MEVKTGYKQTEVGVIPKDWNFGELGSLNPTVTSGSRGWAHYYSDMGSAFIRITNLSRQTIYIDLADLRLVNLPKNDTEGLRTQLHDGDVLISITADIGIVGYVDSTVPKPAYINQHIALVRFDTEKIDSRFLSYYLASESPQRAFRAGTDQGAKAGMNLTGVRNIRAAFPPLPEQRAIATALSDVDALLSKLDQLITKKRDLKQATMQQLLTGQTRLPGFSGEWDVKRLGDVAVMGSGGTPISSVPYFYGGEFPWVSISDMTKGGKVIVSTDRNLSAAGLANSAAQMFPAGTVLYAMYASLGECSIAGVPVCTSQAILGIRPQERLNSEFLYYYLSSLKTVVKSMGQQGTQANLNKGMVWAFQIRLGTLHEQTAIATVLSDMDAELSALEFRREKTQALKQGMMQELLTGRIRLV